MAGHLMLSEPADARRVYLAPDDPASRAVSATFPLDRSRARRSFVPAARMLVDETMERRQPDVVPWASQGERHGRTDDVGFARIAAAQRSSDPGTGGRS